MKSPKCLQWGVICALVFLGITGCDRESSQVADPVRYAVLVEPDGSGSYPTIQEAIDAAADGDVIELADGVFTGDGNRDIDFLGKAITVRSRSGKPSLCVIDCQGGPDDPHRGFIFRNQEGSDSILEGIGITNGHVVNNDEEFGMGGGILCLYISGPTLRNLALVGNQATGGGGLGCYARSWPEITECLFEDNHATEVGGAVMLSEDSSPKMQESLFRNNSAGKMGGAVFVSAHSEPLISHSRFESNTADTGGAVAGDGFTINNSNFMGNQAFDIGGAIAASGSTFINNCILSTNVAENEGGAVHYTGQNFMNGSTLVANRASKHGSGVFSASGSMATITQSIVAFGHSQEGVYAPAGAVVVLECSNIYGNDGGDWTGQIGNQFGECGNICTDPLFCASTPGGPEYCALRDDSPCLNSGCGPMGARPVGCCADVTHVP